MFCSGSASKDMRLYVPFIWCISHDFDGMSGGVVCYLLFAAH